MVEYTKRRNKNRGYMSLRVWHRAIDLYKLVCRIVYVDNKIEFKLRAQIADAASSVSSNISEGYSRRSIHEYIQHIYVALGSLSETLSRAIAFLAAEQISKPQFEELDALHYEVENNLWKLLESLEKKRDQGTWVTRASDNLEDHHPTNVNESHQAIKSSTQSPALPKAINPKIHQSTNPIIQACNDSVE